MSDTKEQYATSIESKVPGEQELREATESTSEKQDASNDEATSKLNTDDEAVATKDDFVYSPVITVTKEETSLTKGDVKLQKVIVTEDISDESTKISRTSSVVESKSTSGEMDSNEEVRTVTVTTETMNIENNNNNVDNNNVPEGDQRHVEKRTKIPKLKFKQAVERVQQERKANKKYIPESSLVQRVRSAIPRLKDSKIAPPDITKTVPKKKEVLKADSPKPDEEFDKLYEEIVENIPTPEKIDDPAKLESKFEEIIHAYDENNIESITFEKSKSRIPLLKRQSEQEIFVPQQYRRSSLKKSVSVDDSKNKDLKLHDKASKLEVQSSSKNEVKLSQSQYVEKTKEFISSKTVEASETVITTVTTTSNETIEHIKLSSKEISGTSDTNSTKKETGKCKIPVPLHLKEQTETRISSVTLNKQPIRTKVVEKVLAQNTEIKSSSYDGKNHNKNGKADSGNLVKINTETQANTHTYDIEKEKHISVTTPVENCLPVCKSIESKSDVNTKANNLDYSKISKSDINKKFPPKTTLTNQSQYSYLSESEEKINITTSNNISEQTQMSNIEVASRNVEIKHDVNDSQKYSPNTSLSISSLSINGVSVTKVNEIEENVSSKGETKITTSVTIDSKGATTTTCPPKPISSQTSQDNSVKDELSNDTKVQNITTLPSEDDNNAFKNIETKRIVEVQSSTTETSTNVVIDSKKDTSTTTSLNQTFSQSNNVESALFGNKIVQNLSKLVSEEENNASKISEIKEISTKAIKTSTNVDIENKINTTTNNSIILPSVLLSQNNNSIDTLTDTKSVQKISTSATEEDNIVCKNNKNKEEIAAKADIIKISTNVAIGINKLDSSTPSYLEKGSLLPQSNTVKADIINTSNNVKKEIKVDRTIPNSSKPLPSLISENDWNLNKDTISNDKTDQNKYDLENKEDKKESKNIDTKEVDAIKSDTISGIISKVERTSISSEIKIEKVNNSQVITKIESSSITEENEGKLNEKINHNKSERTIDKSTDYPINTFINNKKEDDKTSLNINTNLVKTKVSPNSTENKEINSKDDSFPATNASNTNIMRNESKIIDVNKKSVTSISETKEYTVISKQKEITVENKLTETSTPDNSLESAGEVLIIDKESIKDRNTRIPVSSTKSCQNEKTNGNETKNPKDISISSQIKNIDELEEEDIIILKGKVNRIISRLDSREAKIIKSEMEDVPKQASILSKIAMFEQSAPSDTFARNNVTNLENGTKQMEEQIKDDGKPKVVEEFLKKRNLFDFNSSQNTEYKISSKDLLFKGYNKQFTNNVSLSDQTQSILTDNTKTPDNIQAKIDSSAIYNRVYVTSKSSDSLEITSTIQTETKTINKLSISDEAVKANIGFSRSTNYENEFKSLENKVSNILNENEVANASKEYSSLDIYKEYKRSKGLDTDSDMKRAKSLAELDLGDAVKGRVRQMVLRINSIEKLDAERRSVNVERFRRCGSVFDRIAKLENKAAPAQSETALTATAAATPQPQTVQPKIAQPKTVQPLNAASGLTDEQVQERIAELTGAKVRYGIYENATSVDLGDGSSMPVLAVGTALLEPRLLKHIITAAIDLGYRAFDCAFIYGNEKQVGEAIRSKIQDGTVRREELFIISKLWSTFHRRDLVEVACRKSLEAMGLDYFDLYLIHNPMSLKEGSKSLPKIANVLQYSEHDYLDAWIGIENLIRKGLVRRGGVSNFNSVQVERIIEKGKIKPVVNQVECHPYLTQQRLDEFCTSRRVKLSCYGALGSKGTPEEYKSGVPPAIDDPLIKVMAAGLEVTPAQLLIAFQIESGRGVVVKSSSARHLWDNLKAQSVRLDGAHLTAINALNRNKRIFTFKGMGDTHRNYPFKIPF